MNKYAHICPNASIWEIQASEVDSSTRRNNSKILRTGKWMVPYPINDLDCIGSTYPEISSSHPNRAPGIIWETQALPKFKGSVYKDIMASIGLDSLNTSTGSRGEEVKEHNEVASLVVTPIRNSGSCLMALGNHDLTPRQRTIWKVTTSHC